MKYSYILPAVIATAVAQDQCGIVAPPVSEVPEGTARVIAQALIAINGTTESLNSSITAFQTFADAGALAAASGAVLNEINSQNVTVAAQPPLPEGNFDAFALPPYVGGLACTVNFTIENLIRKKQVFVDACIGPLVLQSIQQQQLASSVFQNTTRSKIPPSLQDLSDQIAAPIGDSLSKGVSAFADQTTTPASCAQTTTTTTYNTGKPTGGYGWQPIPYPTENPSYPVTTGGAYPTGNPSYPVTTGGAYPTGGDKPYPTGKGGDEEDCDDEEEHPYPTGSDKPTSYPVWEVYTTSSKGEDSYPTSSKGGDYYPTSSKGGDYYPTSSKGGDYYPTSSKGGDYYPTTYAPAPKPTTTGTWSEWEVSSIPYETTKKPATTTSYAVWTTTSGYVKPTYTGAAVVNAANGFAVVAAVAAALL